MFGNFDLEANGFFLLGSLLMRLLRGVAFGGTCYYGFSWAGHPSVDLLPQTPTPHPPFLQTSLPPSMTNAPLDYILNRKLSALHPMGALCSIHRYHVVACPIML